MATKLSMKDPNPGIWFKFNDNDDDSGEICLRVLTPEKRDEFREKAIKKREKFKHGQRYVIENVNDDLFSKLMWDYSISEWSGLVDDDDADIECNADNKVYLMRNHIGFASFVGDKMTEMSERYESEVTLENENLSKGSAASGTPKDPVAKSAKK